MVVLIIKMFLTYFCVVVAHMLFLSSCTGVSPPDLSEDAQILYESNIPEMSLMQGFV